MIKFNGYPFLEQEDTAYNIPGKQTHPISLYNLSQSGLVVAGVMRRHLHTLNASAMTLQEVGAYRSEHFL